MLKAPSSGAGEAGGVRRTPLTLVVAMLLSLTLALLPGGLRALQQPPPTTVRVLMPSPFVDATAPLVAVFNREHSDLRIEVARGPLDTEAMSDLAIGKIGRAHV